MKISEFKKIIREEVRKVVSENNSFAPYDVKYWTDYNVDTSGQGKKEFAIKSKDFEDTFEDAVSEWNREAEKESMIKGSEIAAIKKLAMEFYKKAGWISVNVIQAMISQEA